MNANGDNGSDDLDMSRDSAGKSKLMSQIIDQAAQWCVLLRPGAVGADHPYHDREVRNGALQEWLLQSSAHVGAFVVAVEKEQRIEGKVEPNPHDQRMAQKLAQLPDSRAKEEALRALVGRRIILTAEDAYFCGTVLESGREVRIEARRWKPLGNVIDGKGQAIGRVRAFFPKDMQAIHVVLDRSGE